MNLDRELLLKIKDAIGACRIDPTHGIRMTLRFKEEDGGGEFKLTIEKLPTKG